MPEMVAPAPVVDEWSNLGRYERHIMDMERGLRSGPGSEFNDEGKPNEAEVFIGDKVDIYIDTVKKDRHGKPWCKIVVIMGKYPGKRGWMAMEGLRSRKQDRITGQIPVLPKVADIQEAVEAPKVETPAPAPAVEVPVLYVRILRIPERLTPSEAALLMKMGVELQLVGSSPEVVKS